MPQHYLTRITPLAWSTRFLSCLHDVFADSHMPWHHPSSMFTFVFRAHVAPFEFCCAAYAQLCASHGSPCLLLLVPSFATGAAICSQWHDVEFLHLSAPFCGATQRQGWRSRGVFLKAEAEAEAEAEAKAVAQAHSSS